MTFINLSDNKFSNNDEFVELVFLEILRVLVSVHLKLASKFSSQFFVLLVYEGFFSFILF